MRANSLTNLGVALDYNVISDYDKVLVLSGIVSEIEMLAPHANEIANLVANLPDVLTVQEASELVNNLTVKVTTLPAGSAATSELVGTEIRLRIPAGTQGVQGLQGPKGDKGDKGDIGLTGVQGPIGLTGPQGPRGLRGNDGVDGVGVEITSVINNPNKSLTINFSDGTQHTTDPLKGQDGTSVTVTNVVNNPNGTMQVNFSDGTSHTTADLTGPRGFKGDTGDHVHHISYQRSKDPVGNEAGPVKPGSPGYTDTYAMWTSQEELPETYIGEFVVHNGSNTLTIAEQARLDSVEFGATRDQEAFEVTLDNTGTSLVSLDVQGAIIELSAGKEDISNKGIPNGYASLDANGQVPSWQLPSYVDDVLEYATYGDLPATGETDKIYIVVADETSGNNTSSYRWSGTVYAMVSNTLTAEDVKALYESNANTNEFTDAEKQKLTDIEENAKDDQTAEEIEALYESRPDTNKYTDTEKTKLANTEITSQLNSRDTANRDRTNHTGTQDLDTITETVDKKVMTAAERDKLVGIETNATADQTGSEIKTLYEAELDTNAYTDASANRVDVDTALNTTATTFPTAINELKVAVDLNTAKQTNVTTDLSYTAGVNEGIIVSSDGTDAVILVADATNAGLMLAVEKTKLGAIEDGATADQTAEEIEILYEGLADTNKYTDNEKLEVAASTVHNTSDGSDHTFIDQDVTTVGNPKFASVQVTGGTGDEGKLTWNSDEATIDLNHNGTTLQLGQEIHVHVRNNTGSLITNGTVVMATGAIGASGRITVAPYDGTSAVKYILGVTTEDIGVDADGKVTSFGKIRGLDTSTWLEGNELFATANGGLTNVEPTTGVNVAIAYVVSSHASVGTIMVRFTPLNSNEFELRDSTILKDADIGTTVQAYNADTVIDANYIAYTQTEKDKVANIPDNTDLVLGTTAFTRFDKILGSMDIIDMDYLNGDLVTVRYTGDNDTNVFYRDVLEYADGDLTTVKHYYNTADLVIESGLTTLVYDIDKNLISSNYTEV